MRLRQATTVALVLTLAGVLAAVATASMSPAVYRASANAACTKANVKQKLLGSPKTKAQFLGFLELSIPIGRQELRTLTALDPPALLRPAHRRALGFIKRELALLDGLVVRIKGGADPIAAFGKVTPEGNRLAAAENAAWRSAGVAACAKG
jgi:hypothetical protein